MRAQSHIGNSGSEHTRKPTFGVVELIPGLREMLLLPDCADEVLIVRRSQFCQNFNLLAERQMFQ